MTGTRVRTKRRVLANKRHKKGMVELPKGSTGTVNEVVGDTATVQFDRIPDPLCIHVANLETEDHWESHRE